MTGLWGGVLTNKTKVVEYKAINLIKSYVQNELSFAKQFPIYFKERYSGNNPKAIPYILQ